MSCVDGSMTATETLRCLVVVGPEKVIVVAVTQRTQITPLAAEGHGCVGNYLF